MQLELYQMEGCPYCAKVRQKLSNLGASYITHNPRENEETMEELIDMGGKDQVPFLVVRDDSGDIVESMYESDDINAWLDDHITEPQNTSPPTVN